MHRGGEGVGPVGAVADCELEPWFPLAFKPQDRLANGRTLEHRL